MVTIYGKDSCPYTRAARDDFEAQGEVTYVNVRKDPAGLQQMLVHSKGRRVVPVIVERDGKVTIGWDGGT
jgi:glutaredoxin 3